MKRCSKCKEYKDISKFNKHRKEPDGLYSQCRECSNDANNRKYKENPQKWIDYAKRWKKENPEKVTRINKKWYDNNKHIERNSRLKRTYGITQEDYKKMHKAQDGKCLICQSPSDKKLHIDHNHKTGEVRGLLCNKCNKALGFIKEDIGILERMKRYINEKN